MTKEELQHLKETTKVEKSVADFLIAAVQEVDEVIKAKYQVCIDFLNSKKGELDDNSCYFLERFFNELFMSYYKLSLGDPKDENCFLIKKYVTLFIKINQYRLSKFYYIGQNKEKVGESIKVELMDMLKVYFEKNNHISAKMKKHVIDYALEEIQKFTGSLGNFYSV